MRLRDVRLAILTGLAGILHSTAQALLRQARRIEDGAQPGAGRAGGPPQHWLERVKDARAWYGTAPGGKAGTVPKEQTLAEMQAAAQIRPAAVDSAALTNLAADRKRVDAVSSAPPSARSEQTEQPSGALAAPENPPPTAESMPRPSWRMRIEGDAGEPRLTGAQTPAPSVPQPRAPQPRLRLRPPDAGMPAPRQTAASAPPEMIRASAAAERKQPASQHALPADVRTGRETNTDNLPDTPRAAKTPFRPRYDEPELPYAGLPETPGDGTARLPVRETAAPGSPHARARHDEPPDLDMNEKEAEQRPAVFFTGVEISRPAAQRWLDLPADQTTEMELAAEREAWIDDLREQQHAQKLAREQRGDLWSA